MTALTDRVLDIREVSKSFTLHTRGGVALRVLDRQSLQLHAGECVALSGPSGRGKSTLVKCLYGTYSIDQGRMVLTRNDGAAVDLAGADPQTWMQLRLRQIAFVSQFLRTLPRRSAIDVVAARLIEADDMTDQPRDGQTAPIDESAWLEQWAAARSRAAEMLKRLHLPRSLWPLPPATFSGGEQQRVNIARAFVLPCRLLLLDEPTSALDAGNRAVVIELIREAKAAGTAVVGIFHDEAVRDAVADRRIEMTTVSA